MVEFGAKLSLKDNMSATIQKNIQMQKKFTDQLKKTSAKVKELGKAKIKPIIDAKDKATAVVKKVKDTLKSVGKVLAKPIVAIKDKASAGLEKIKKSLSKLAKGIKIGVSVLGAGVGAVIGGAVSQGSSLEQSKGGVETLYKGDASKVLEKANVAYKTAGLSANAYMETVTSFSASLLSSLGGDTAKSAEIADMAIIDMADNAGKFGSDMESIQQAYQGFAKGQYQLLDNLKLGYGGTQGEMERLLKDAQKISGVKYDIKNLSDVYSAIHVIQDNLGVTGTTAKEASATFTGSFNSMKSAFQNVLGAMATGGDVEGTMEEFVSSAITFLSNNAIPMIVRVAKSLPKALKVGFEQAKPELMKAGADLWNNLKSGILNVLPASVQGIATSVFGGIEGIFKNLPTIIEKAKTMFSNFVTATEPIRTTLVSIFSQVGEKVKVFVGVIQEHMPTFKAIFDATIPAVQSVLSVAWSVISPIIDLCIAVFDELMSCVGVAFPTIQNIIEKVWDVLKGIFEGFANGINNLKDAVSGLGEKIGNGINTVGSWFGFAYGKDRVPYDNYPAVLHQGEKVLTRNQADQYERTMSTRGITLGATVTAPKMSSTGSGASSVNVEKLAETVIIEKDADVDKVVEEMIAKFRKLVPNMA